METSVITIPIIVTSDGGDSKIVADIFEAASNDNVKFEIIDLTTDKVKNNIKCANSISKENLIFYNSLEKLREYLLDTGRKSGIIIKDTSLTVISDKDLPKLIIEMYDNPKLIYLAKWKDRCYLYRNESQIIPEHQIKLVDTFSPNGVQALMVSLEMVETLLRKEVRHNRNKVPPGAYLNELVKTDCIEARATVPSIFEYDIINYAKSAEDYDKANECTNASTDDNGGGINTATYLYVTGIVALIIIMGWAMYVLGPDGRKGTTSDPNEELVKLADKVQESKRTRADKFKT